MKDLIAFINDIENGLWPKEKWEVNSGVLKHTTTAGVLQFTPKQSSTIKKKEKLVLSVGIHGNETAPIEIVWDILNQIKTEDISPVIETLFIFGHTKAMLEHKRFIDFNLNRLFSDNYKNFPHACESKRAQELEQAMYTFFENTDISIERWHLDLHTAIRGSHHERFVVRPFYEDGRPISQEEISLCAKLGIEAILKTTSPAPTFSGFSATELKGQSFTVELGKVSKFGENNLTHFQKAKNTLIDILKRGTLRFDEAIDNQDQTIENLPIIYDVEKELINDHDDYEFFLDEDYSNFTPLEEGQPIEKNRHGVLYAKRGQSVVFPNAKVPQGQRTGLLVHAQ